MWIVRYCCHINSGYQCLDSSVCYCCESKLLFPTRDTEPKQNNSGLFFFSSYSLTNSDLFLLSLKLNY